MTKASMTKVSPAYSYTICLVVVLLGGACSILSSPEDDKLTQPPKQETVKPTPHTPHEDRLHEVRDGETLSAIALMTTGDARNWKTIADINNIIDPNTIKKGQVIVVPRSLIPPPGPPTVGNSKPQSISEKPTPASEPPSQDSKSATERGRTAHTSGPDTDKPLAQKESGGWLVIRGTNYPREINTGPDSSSDILIQVWPGTRMRYVDRIDGWYKVTTDKGQGYLNPDYATVQP